MKNILIVEDSGDFENVRGKMRTNLHFYHFNSTLHFILHAFLCK